MGEDIMNTDRYVSRAEIDYTEKDEPGFLPEAAIRLLKLAFERGAHSVSISKNELGRWSVDKSGGEGFTPAEVRNIASKEA